MTVVDTSALLAVVFGEPDASRYAEAMLADQVVVSAATLVEASIVVEARQGPEAVRDLTLLLEEVGAEVAPLDEEAAALAVAAWRRFGRGRHPAGLNLGDCYSYATAVGRGEPLLFKGDDFAATDVTAAIRT